MRKTILYKLNGKSLRTAQNLRDSVICGDTSTQELFALEEKSGLNNAIIQIRHNANEYPRAYSVTPVIYSIPSDPVGFFMECPIGYDGKIFSPPDAQPLSDKEADDIYAQLFDTSGNPHHDPSLNQFGHERRGTNPPTDYVDSEYDTSKKDSWCGANIYMARPAAKNAVYNFFTHQETREKIYGEIEKIIHEQLKKIIVCRNDRVELVETLRGFVAIRENHLRGRKEIWIDAASSETEVSYPTPDTPAWIAAAREDNDEGEETTMIYPDIKNEIGKKLTELLESMPPRRNFGDFIGTTQNNNDKAGTSEVFKKNAEKNIFAYDEIDIRILGTHIFLMNEGPLLRHPDLSPISFSTFKWLTLDIDDERHNIVPPPMPRQVKTELENLHLLPSRKNLALKSRTPL